MDNPFDYIVVGGGTAGPVLPNLISGHTMAPTILVAERAADFIKNKY